MINCINCKIFAASDEAYRFIFNQWLTIASEAIQKKENFTVALSGGKTPIPLFKMLRSNSGNIFWENTHVFMVDERFVPENHPDSNQQIIRENLIGHNLIPDEHFHAIPIKEDSKSSANAYQSMLVDFFCIKPGKLPVFDLILLGIGEDGHTASLFPGDPKIMHSQGIVHSINLNRLKHARITLTLPVLNQAKNIYFVVLGREKAKIVKTVVEGKNRVLPATSIDPINGKLLFILDREAASLLEIPE